MSKDKSKIHCNSCGQLTWHTESAELTRDYTVPEAPEPGDRPVQEVYTGYEILTCLGCDVSSFRTWTSVDGEFITELESFYPPRTLGLIQPKNFRKVERKLGTIYKEIIEAFNARSHILCAAGLRALLEGICKERGVRGRTLGEKIDSLDEWVPTSVVKNLHGYRFLGNEALHRLDTPDAEDLALAIDVVEDVMNAIYELDYKSGRLMQRLTERNGVGSNGAGANARVSKTKRGVSKTKAG